LVTSGVYAEKAPAGHIEAEQFPAFTADIVAK